MKAGTLLIFFLLAATVNLHAQAEWSVGTDLDSGWALRKGENDVKPSRFFAIGLWGFPSDVYRFTTNNSQSVKEANDPDEDAFQTATENFNLFYLDNRKSRKLHYKNKSILSGWSDVSFVGNRLYTPKSMKKRYMITYKQMLEIRSDPSDFQAELINIVKDNKKELTDKGYDLIWFLADEPDRGSYTQASWTPELMKLLHETVKQVSPHTVTFLDLGPTEGNLYLHELQMNNFDSADINFTPRVRDYAGNEPSATYFQANVAITAKAYGESSDILGINSYAAFNSNPKNAALTLDTIRCALPDKPIWLFFRFDAGTSANEFRCAVYTAIVHGATGILFYYEGKTNPPSQYWIEQQMLAKELNANQRILKGTTISWSSDGDIHQMIKDVSNDTRYYIVTNTGESTVDYKDHTGATVEIPGYGVLIFPASEAAKNRPGHK